MPENLRVKIADFLAKLPPAEEVEKYKEMPLTKEEEKSVAKLVKTGADISQAMLIIPIMNHGRWDAVIRRAVARLKEIVPDIRTD